MVASVSHIICFLDDPVDTPDSLVEPEHEPLRSAFVPYSTGFLMNEMKSYMEWMADRGNFSWMNEEWEYVEDLYSYWPYMENSVGDLPDPYYYAYDPSIVYALVQVADDSFTVLGVSVLNEPPGLRLAKILEEQYPSKGLTRLNLSVVPLEMIDLPEEKVASVVYYWANTLRTLDWSSPVYRIDSLVYWSNTFRERINAEIHGETYPTVIKVEPDPTPKFKSKAAKLEESSDVRYYPTQEDMLRVRGLYWSVPTYNDPMFSASFMADLRTRMPELPSEVTAEEISFFFRTGVDVPSIGIDPGVYHKLNAILCMYPEDVQDRFLSGVGTSLDPSNVDRIGAGFNVGRKPNRLGERLLSYEELLQPGP